MNLLRIFSPQTVSQDLNDELLTFENGSLTFFSYKVRYHSPKAQYENREEAVAGYQTMICFELTLTEILEQKLVDYLKQQSYGTQLTFQTFTL